MHTADDHVRTGRDALTFDAATFLERLVHGDGACCRDAVFDDMGPKSLKNIAQRGRRGGVAGKIALKPPCVAREFDEAVGDVEQIEVGMSENTALRVAGLLYTRYL